MATVDKAITILNFDKSIFFLNNLVQTNVYYTTIKRRKAEISSSIEIFNKTIDECTISNSDLRMPIDKIEISEQDGKLDINIILNGKFNEHTLYFDEVQRLNLVSKF